MGIARFLFIFTFSSLLFFFSDFQHAKAAPEITVPPFSNSWTIGQSYQVSVTVSGFSANSPYYIKLRLGLNSSELNKGQTNNSGNSSPDDWLSDTDSWVKFPVINTDSAGAWSGTITARASVNASSGQNQAVVRVHRADPSDNFDSAFKHTPEEVKNSDWLKGMEHIRKQMEDILERAIALILALIK